MNPLLRAGQLGSKEPAWIFLKHIAAEHTPCCSACLEATDEGNFSRPEIAKYWVEERTRRILRALFGARCKD